MIAPRLLDAGCLNQPCSYKASMTVVISSRELNARHRQAGAWKRHGGRFQESRIAAGQTWNRAVRRREPKLAQEIGRSLDPFSFLPVSSRGKSWTLAMPRNRV